MSYRRHKENSKRFFRLFYTPDESDIFVADKKKSRISMSGLNYRIKDKRLPGKSNHTIDSDCTKKKFF